MHPALFDTFTTPLGPFSIGIDATGALIATAFGDQSRLALRAPGHAWQRDPERLATPRQQVIDYLVGARRTFEVPCRAAGSAFQQRVWAELTQIPFGETRSYGALARSLGTSARAIGRANATNPLCLIVPCHRVIGADGALTGFAFGESIKRALLELEGVCVAGGEPELLGLSTPA